MLQNHTSFCRQKKKKQQPPKKPPQKVSKKPSLQHFLCHVHILPDVTSPPLSLSMAEPGRTRKEQYQKFQMPLRVPTQRHFVCSHTPNPSDVLSAKLIHKCLYLVVGDPPGTGDNTGIPGSTVTQGHHACLCQGSWRDRFTYKGTPNTSMNLIHAKEMNSQTSICAPIPCEPSRCSWQRQHCLVKLEGSMDRAEAVSAAAIFSSPTG